MLGLRVVGMGGSGMGVGDVRFEDSAAGYVGWWLL